MKFLNKIDQTSDTAQLDGSLIAKSYRLTGFLFDVTVANGKVVSVTSASLLKLDKKEKEKIIKNVEEFIYELSYSAQGFKDSKPVTWFNKNIKALSFNNEECIDFSFK